MNRWFFAICAAFLAGTASAQQPIVAVKAMPEKGALQGAVWNKPLVLNSSDAAAKVFGKAELERLAKEVDFKKQFVLVIAWQGSSGDKLDFAVAESFPEQILFTLRPGLTDDRSQHLHVYALRSNVRWSIRSEARKSTQAKPLVRPLPVTLTARETLLRSSRTPNPITYSSVDQVESIHGKKTAKRLIEGVDFSKEMLVMVYWSELTDRSRLEYKFIGNGPDRVLLFFVGQAAENEPFAKDGPRTNFFAVPRSTKVKYFGQ